jgi:hypothetical protein
MREQLKSKVPDVPRVLLQQVKSESSQGLADRWRTGHPTWPDP